MAGRRGWATWGAGGLAAWLAAGALLARPALATPGIGTVFVGRYPFLRGGQLDSCATCHMPIERDCLNAYGLALRAAGLDFGRVEPLDSDGDGLSNLQEIRRQRPPGSQAAYPEYFIFHTAFSEGDPELGLVHFNHEMHSVKASFLARGRCATCHGEGLFPKRFDDSRSVRRLAHQLCWDCHNRSSSELAPKDCTGCHQGVERVLDRLKEVLEGLEAADAGRGTAAASGK